MNISPGKVYVFNAAVHLASGITFSGTPNSGMFKVLRKNAVDTSLGVGQI